MKDEIKVIFAPDYTKGNPYQLLLSNSLKKLGVDVKIEGSANRFTIIKLLRKHKDINVLHLHWSHPFLLAGNTFKSILKSVLFITELLWVKILKIKIIWTVHNVVSHESPNKRLELYFNHLIAVIADTVIVHSSSAKGVIIEEYKIKNCEKISIIPHANFIDFYENNIDKNTARNKLKLPSNEFVYLYFGLIRNYKGLDKLINSFKNLNKENIRLLIVGKPFNSDIKNQVEQSMRNSKNITFIADYIPDSDIQLYMNASDVVVLPYKNFLTSSILMLAMSFKRAVIAPSTDYVKEFLGNSCELLYDPSEGNALQDTLDRATKMDNSKIGMVNYEYIKQFNWDKMAALTYAAYKG